jgi:hypothetical protein
MGREKKKRWKQQFGEAYTKLTSLGGAFQNHRKFGKSNHSQIEGEADKAVGVVAALNQCRTAESISASKPVVGCSELRNSSMGTLANSGRCILELLTSTVSFS